MTWVRIHDGALSHPKLIKIFQPRDPFDLWVWGLSYSQQHLTDGFVPQLALPWKASKKTVQQLIDLNLWSPKDDGYQIHDYLDWNDAKVDVVQGRALAKARMVLVRDPKMRQALRDRDRDHCRYCHMSVVWTDRKGPRGATYDHVIPGGGDTLENLVIACRGCNSRKGRKTPDEAGMTLLAPISHLGRNLNTDINKLTPLEVGGVDSFHSSEFSSETKPKPISVDSVDWFDRVYAAYPNKDRKEKALRQWIDMALDLATSEKILRDIQRRIDAGWVRLERRFIPQLATFLHDRMWQDAAAPEPFYDEGPAMPHAWQCTFCGEIHEGTAIQARERKCLQVHVVRDK